MTTIEFTKMHGLGNDFVVIDAVSQAVHLSREQVKAMADRHFGIGCDQLLLVEKPSDPAADFRYRIFNADGGEVEQCGNGARCFAIFVRDKGLTDKSIIPVETATGLIELKVEKDQVTVNMGIPDFQPESLPFVTEETKKTYNLVANGVEYDIGAVSMGNPHAVLIVDDIDSTEVNTIGASIESHKQFPKRVNVGFMEIVNRGEIRLRVYERGVGETMACGTGACAAVAVGRLLDKLDERVTVNLRGGKLLIEWPDDGESLYMSGPATTVFQGKIDFE
jgi:diaminopimelate epimerase